MFYSVDICSRSFEFAYVGPPLSFFLLSLVIKLAVGAGIVEIVWGSKPRGRAWYEWYHVAWTKKQYVVFNVLIVCVPQSSPSPLQWQGRYGVPLSVLAYGGGCAKPFLSPLMSYLHPALPVFPSSDIERFHWLVSATIQWWGWISWEVFILTHK